MATTVGTESTAKDLIESLLHLEHDAIAAYEATIKRLDTAEFKERMTAFKADHDRHLVELHELADAVGAARPTSGDFKQMLTTGKVNMANLTGGDGAAEFDDVTYHRGVDVPAVRIAFDRPEVRNAFRPETVDELYTAIGFNRHGKTEFYRTLREHLTHPDARFEPTPGKEGLVMIVFTLPRLNTVFKVIRDRFGAPKKTSRERVKRNYGLIFVRDRVGRLADAQQFERLELPRDRFGDEVLHDLLENAGRTAHIAEDDPGTVIIEHLYTERRVHPLDLYLEDADPEEARRATLEFGQAIKDLAAADIFPGDMLVKNFGVTRHGRVIFYDYDEVAPLGDCNFRRRPKAAYPEAELADTPHFYVGPDDIFPEEWRAFLGPAGPLRKELHEAHPELFDPEWWRGMQERHQAGEVIDFFPYDQRRRLGDHGSGH